jgi:integrase
VAGHIQDRWWRDSKDENDKLILDARGKPVREKTGLHGKGLRYKVHYYDENSNERSKSFPDKQLKKAQDFLTKMQHDVLSGVYLDPDLGKMKLREYARTVLMGRSQDESSMRVWMGLVRNQIDPFLGGRELGSINTDVVRKWLAWMNARERRPAQSYQKQCYDLLSSILDAAVSDRRMRVNPCLDKSISRPAVGPKKVAPWAESKMRKIELALPAREQIAVPLGAGLGLRQGEIFAFSMDNIDRDNMMYHCTRQVVKVGKELKFKLPKGHKVRDVPLGAGVLEKLDAYAENYPPVSIVLPWGELDGRKFETVNVLMTNDRQEVWRAQPFDKTVWLPAFKRAGLVYERTYGDGMHALRHLFASWMLQQGVSIKELAAFLGHASEAFTLRTYVHLMPNSYDRARTAVNTMFKPRRQSSTKDGSVG